MDGTKRDRYSRIIGRVIAPYAKSACTPQFCPDRYDVNLCQIAMGMAWHFKKYVHKQSRADRRFYSGAEARARRKRLGL